MDRILFVTGREAERKLAEVVGKENVYVADVSVAALINAESLASELKKKKVRASLVVVPGTVQGDVSVVAEKTEIPCIKGTKHLSNLPLMLEHLDARKFSTKKPAEEVLEDEIKKANEKMLAKASKLGKAVLRIGRKNPLLLNGLCHVVSEIPDAPILSERDLASSAEYYVSSGASIIDVGMISGKDYSSEIAGMVQALRRRIKAPISLDSMNEEEILAAEDAGVDMIMSLDEKSIGISHSLKTPVVVVPRKKDGKIPETVSERVRLLEHLLNEAGCPAIADPLMAPLGQGFVWSIASYIKFRGRNPETPMLLGAGNVTELADADSPGMNMLLAGFASELNIQLLFTTEASPKTRGCVRELSQACKMMYLSKKIGQPPKDLGFDLLELKDKRTVEPVLDPNIHEAQVVYLTDERKTKPDAKNFRIYLKDGKINAVYYSTSKPTLLFKGESARKLYKEIIARGLVTGTHAAYLGKELSKAEIALKIGKNYVQDEELFD